MARLTTMPTGSPGKPKSAEHRAKLAASLSGRKRTPEQRARISASKLTEVPSYQAMHKRMGPASARTCACGQPALDWALQPTCQEPLHSPEGLAYSTNPEDYEAMCRKCHNLLDGVVLRRAADGTFR